MKKSAKKLKFIARKNPFKAYMLFKIYIESVLRYQRKAKGANFVPGMSDKIKEQN